MSETEEEFEARMQRRRIVQEERQRDRDAEDKFDEEAGDALRAHGFTDPERQVGEAVELLRTDVADEAPADIYEVIDRAKKLLAELDAGKTKGEKT